MVHDGFGSAADHLRMATSRPPELLVLPRSVLAKDSPQAPLRRIQYLMGHNSITTTERYAHLVEEEAYGDTRALEKMSRPFYQVLYQADLMEIL